MGPLSVKSAKRRRTMARYDSILGTIGNTPVVRINRLAPAGVNLYVKVEAFNPLGSVKDRLALAVIEAVRRSGEVQHRPTAVQADNGNTRNSPGHGLTGQ